MGEIGIEIGEGIQLIVISPTRFKLSEFYLEARNAPARIIIGEKVLINNGCSIIVDKNTIEIGDDALTAKASVVVKDVLNSVVLKGIQAGYYQLCLLGCK